MAYSHLSAYLYHWNPEDMPTIWWDNLKALGFSFDERIRLYLGRP